MLPIQRRIEEARGRPEAVESLRKLLSEAQQLSEMLHKVDAQLQRLARLANVPKSTANDTANNVTVDNSTQPNATEPPTAAPTPALEYNLSTIIGVDIDKLDKLVANTEVCSF